MEAENSLAEQPVKPGIDHPFVSQQMLHYEDDLDMSLIETDMITVGGEPKH
jgi:hypothetical protein